MMIGALHESFDLQKLKRSVRALYLAASDTHTFALTGGTDKCVRYWDLKRPATSFIVNHGHGGHVVQRGAVSYLYSRLFLDFQY